MPHVDDRNHLVAIRHDAFDPLGHAGHRARLGVPEHTLDGEYVGGEEVRSEVKDHELHDVFLHFLSPSPAIAAPSSALASSIPINSPSRRTSPTRMPSDASAPPPGALSMSASSTATASYTSSIAMPIRRPSSSNNNAARSEERRVGKECRSRRSPYQ